MVFCLAFYNFTESDLFYCEHCISLYFVEKLDYLFNQKDTFETSLGQKMPDNIVLNPPFKKTKNFFKVQLKEVRDRSSYLLNYCGDL